MKTETIREVPFLFYVKEGDVISNKEINKMGSSLKGWLVCANVLRNAHKHKPSDIKASLYTLGAFIKNLKEGEQIQETDLLAYL
jgi:hypothetical protein